MLFKSLKPTTPVTVPARPTGPVPLTAAELRQVVGGSPKGTWEAGSLTSAW